jgi:hypothetical protein
MSVFHIIMPRLIFHITITVGEITMAENLAAVAANARENSLPAAPMGASSFVPVRLRRGLIPWLGPLTLLHSPNGA